MKQVVAYPRVSKRMQAFLIDGIIVPVAVISSLFIISALGVHGIDSVIFAGSVVFLFEPALVSFTGGTLGHHLLGLRVVSKKTVQNITIISAVFRFVSKIILGFFSIVTFFTTRQYQAVHDLLIGSIVILRNPQTLNSHEVLGEQEIEQPGYSYPSKVRRSIMGILYNIALFIVLEAVLEFFLSEKCFNKNQCSGGENLFAYSLSILWMIGVFVSIILCWRALLFGCRRILNNI